MSFGAFLLGLLIMVAGFFMVWRTNVFLQWFGDLSAVLGGSGRWLSWKLVGVLFLLFGFLLMTGLLDLFLKLTVGRLFSVGGI